MSHLEVCIFLGRELRARQIRRADRTSKTKVAHLLRIQHRDEVEAPITDWLREAYGMQDAPAGRAKEKGKKKKDKNTKKKPVRKASRRATKK
jgi:glutamyl-tRNA reductase